MVADFLNWPWTQKPDWKKSRRYPTHNARNGYFEQCDPVQNPLNAERKAFNIFLVRSISHCILLFFRLAESPPSQEDMYIPEG